VLELSSATVDSTPLPARGAAPVYLRIKLDATLWPAVHILVERLESRAAKAGARWRISHLRHEGAGPSDLPHGIYLMIEFEQPSEHRARREGREERRP